jgi:hypothetical protein
MVRTLRNLPRILLVVAIALGATSVVRHCRNDAAYQRRLLEASRVRVVDLRDTDPPELTVEFENAGNVTIGRTHFRLGVYVGDRQTSRADEDHGGFTPGQKRRIVLRSRVTPGSGAAISYPARATYMLVVVPEWRAQLPAITREFMLTRGHADRDKR